MFQIVYLVHINRLCFHKKHNLKHIILAIPKKQLYLGFSKKPKKHADCLCQGHSEYALF